MKDNDIPVKEALLGPKGMRAMSVVDSPAIEVDFLTLSKQEFIKLKVQDKEQQLVIGPALIANKKIYREDKDGNPFYIFFSTETVKKIAHNFMSDGNQNIVTLEHEQVGSGFKMVESWLSKQDGEMGFDTKKGDWFVAYKVEDSDTWEKVKDGDFNGFSIEVHTEFIDSDIDNEELFKDIENQVDLIDSEVIQEVITNLDDTINSI